ncbi:trx-h1/thioredoxin-1 [Blumeria hordei DH14]|uniref:Thioredoxin n=1 Tax=Blumeria graminis f. sp. hordei (strain DH14) TaxID=546991 RepID=N1JBC0_BLUG1|nr:trx-h1/thioredoxin-1 [Blumeria hordei DH14]
MVVHTVTSLDEYRKLAKKHEKIIIKFTAEWCGPCRMIAPIFESLSDEAKDIHFISVDVDNSSDISSEFGIKAMPTFVFIRFEDKINEFRGADRNKLTDFTKALKDL